MWILYTTLPHNIRNAMPASRAEITFSPEAIKQKEKELRIKMQTMDEQTTMLRDVSVMLHEAGEDMHEVRDMADEGRKKGQDLRLQLAKLLEMLPRTQAIINGGFAFDIRTADTLDEVRAYTAGGIHV